MRLSTFRLAADFVARQAPRSLTAGASYAISYRNPALDAKIADLQKVIAAQYEAAEYAQNKAKYGADDERAGANLMYSTALGEIERLQSELAPLLEQRLREFTAAREDAQARGAAIEAQIELDRLRREMETTRVEAERARAEAERARARADLAQRNAEQPKPAESNTLPIIGAALAIGALVFFGGK